MWFYWLWCDPEAQSKWQNFFSFQRLYLVTFSSSLRNEAVYRRKYKIFPAVLTTSNFRPYSLGAYIGLDTSTPKRSTQSLGTEVSVNEVTSSAVNQRCSHPGKKHRWAYTHFRKIKGWNLNNTNDHSPSTTVLKSNSTDEKSNLWKYLLRIQISFKEF